MVWTPGKAIPPPSTLLTDAKKSGFAPVDFHPTLIREEEWLSLPSLQLWQAVALSCGILPTSYLDASVADGVANERDFNRRMQVALGHLTDGGKIRAIEKHERLHLTRVIINDVANLAKLCEWRVPDWWPMPEEKEKDLIKKRKDAILLELKARGINPHALPAKRKGISTVKAEIRKFMKGKDSPLFISDKCFDNTWQEMLNKGLLIWGNE